MHMSKAAILTLQHNLRVLDRTNICVQVTLNYHSEQMSYRASYSGWVVFRKHRQTVQLLSNPLSSIQWYIGCVMYVASMSGMSCMSRICRVCHVGRVCHVCRVCYVCRVSRVVQDIGTYLHFKIKDVYTLAFTDNMVNVLFEYNSMYRLTI